MYGFSWWLSDKESTSNAGATEDECSFPGSGTSPGWEHDNLLQDSCLENPMDREAWEAIVHSIAKSWTQLKLLSTHVDLVFLCNFFSQGKWRSRIFFQIYTLLLVHQYHKSKGRIMVTKTKKQTEKQQILDNAHDIPGTIINSIDYCHFIDKGNWAIFF